MDKTSGYQASIDYLMPIVKNPVMTGEYCRHLRNSIDAMIKFERIRSELERLNAENAKLRAVVDAARNLPCPIWEHSNPVEDKLWDVFITALAELDEAKEG